MATFSTAEKNALSFIFEGMLKPLIFLTNCSEAAWISASVTGGSKLNKVLMFLHMILHFDASKCSVRIPSFVLGKFYVYFSLG